MSNMLVFNNPIVRCYQHYAFPMGIIGKQLADETYLLNLFTSLVYNSNSLWCIEFNHPYFLSCDGLFMAGNAMYPSEYEKTEELITFVKKRIDAGVYVSGNWNEFFIPEKENYQKKEYVRNYLLYGYDDEAQAFSSAGYVGYNIWKEFTVSYDDFLNSLFLERGSYCFNLYQYNRNFNKGIDCERIAADFNGYVHSRPWKDTKDIFGIDGIEAYFRNFILFTDRAGMAVLPPMQALYEHKDMMARRLTYMAQENFIIVPESSLKEIAELPKLYRHLINRGIKYNLTGRREVLDEITDMGLDAVNQERQLLKQVKFR